MKLKTILFVASVLATGLVSVVACSSSSSDNGPVNQPPVADAGPDGSTDNGDGSPTACTNSFDNTRVPGWPNSVPQP
ncbi:MAG: hypothetical protein FWD69_13030 [Polyangiaceae bacterium]|nr:hypothetical protein [Polyangiaceae bacterium]